MTSPLRRGVASSQVSDWLGDSNFVVPANYRPVASGGNESTITDSGVTYRLHEFATSGTFSVIQGPIDIEFLLVGGGGGGGRGGGDRAGSGGGGGGVISNVGSKKITLAVGDYTVTVGAGGAIGPNYLPASNGGTTSFGAFLYAPGGAGGRAQAASTNTIPGLIGACGSGGPSPSVNGTIPAGEGIFPFGNNGGTGNGSTTADAQCAGGGGGAGAVGGNASSTNGGNGGNGVSNSITGASVTYGGGGGGAKRTSVGGSAGTGGTGGGGDGQTATTGGTDGTDGLGGGGGGCVSVGRVGGDGIVFIRYQI